MMYLKRRMIDFVFVLDITSSMRPYVENLKVSFKRNFFTVIKEMEKRWNAKVDWRIRFITFKDLDCPTDTEPKIDNSNPFSNNETEVLSQIERIKVEKYQGCDYPESVLEALYVAARKTSWRNFNTERRYENKIIILLTDAIPKERFNTSVLEFEDRKLPFNQDVDSTIMSLGEILREVNVHVFLYAPEQLYL